MEEFRPKALKCGKKMIIFQKKAGKSYKAGDDGRCMTNALAKKNEGGGFDAPMERLMIRLDELTFSRVQSAEKVLLRVYCPDNHGSVNFLLKNMGTKKDGWMTLDMNMEERSFLNVMNPKLKVVFQSQNVLAPFASVSMARGALFSEKLPLSDMAN